MQSSTIFTLGHGNKTKEEFLSILQKFSIQYLSDVRSIPFSKHNPNFNQNEIKSFLEKNGITYVFMGDTLGGRPKDTSCYDCNGKVDYEILKTKDFFVQGINRIKIAHHKQLHLAIMCSESKPCECHRSKLIGKVLSSENILINHIDEKGIPKDQSTIMLEINKGVSELNLFGEQTIFTSRKSYI